MPINIIEDINYAADLCCNKFEIGWKAKTDHLNVVVIDFQKVESQFMNSIKLRFGNHIPVIDGF